jgi:hypothetical protein
MRARLALGVLLTIAAAAVPASALPTQESVDMKIRIQSFQWDTGDDTMQFYGENNADTNAGRKLCGRDRSIALFRVVPGPNPRVARGHTEQHGSFQTDWHTYSRPISHFPVGKYVAKLRRIEREGVICEKARSKPFEFNGIPD